MPIVLDMLPAKRFDTLQPALSFLDKRLGGLGHDGLLVTGIFDSLLALFHNLSKRSDDELVDVVHGE